MTDTITQCRLRCGSSEMASWIRTSDAVVGRHITLIGIDGLWEVIETFNTIPSDAWAQWGSCP